MAYRTLSSADWQRGAFFDELKIIPKRRLRERFPEAIHHTFGIDPGALTANEARSFSGF
jgi:hypothetical protein